MCKISIIIPTYNRKNKLKIAIDSVLNQTFRDYEIIVVNDAGESVRPLINSYFNKKIKYLSNKTNLGLAGTRNVGIENANGQYICFLDDDDFLYPNHFETLITGIENYNDYSGVYTDAKQTFIDECNRKLYSKVHFSIDWNKQLFSSTNYIHVLNYMIKKEVIESLNGFDSKMLSFWEDYDFLLRLSRKYELKHLPITTCEYIKHKGGTLFENNPKYLKCLNYFKIKNKDFLNNNITNSEYRKKMFDIFFEARFKMRKNEFLNKKIVIFGTGEGSTLFSEFINKENMQIEFYIQNTVENKFFNSKKIIAVKDFFNKYKLYLDDYYIFICVSNLKIIFDILQEFNSQNFKNFSLMI
jgi:glycosyltransferase involved in cell wall biosynthesis